jgi:pyrimidine-nucleoside phosphorylase
MTAEETAAYTRAIAASGQMLDLAPLGACTVDKHSTGGVGDKASLVLAPAVAACGAPVPMLSGRGLGHTGGTLDKLEAIPGFRAELSGDEFIRAVRSAGCAIVGQTPDLAPADRILYALRDVTATVDSIPLIVGSIVGKKLAAGPAALVYDIKVGSGAFMRTLDDARQLGRALVDATRANGRKASALLTSMDAPLGCAIGNALEVAEAIEALHGGGPPDLRALVIALGGEMLRLAGVELDVVAARAKIASALDDGSAAEVFARMVAAQGGEPRVLDDPRLLPTATHTHEAKVGEEGIVRRLDARILGATAVELGAGRTEIGGKLDLGVGIQLLVKPGSSVKAGQPIAVIHAATKVAARHAAQAVLTAVTIGEALEEQLPPLVVEQIC